jgi:hypothetical protein
VTAVSTSRARYQRSVARRRGVLAEIVIAAADCSRRRLARLETPAGRHQNPGIPVFGVRHGVVSSQE